MIRSLLRALPAAALFWCSLPAEAQDFAALAAVNKLADGGFETPTPSYWAPTGAGATWATDQFHSGTHSLKLSGSGASSWTQSEVIRNWVPSIAANTALFTIRAWVRTEGSSATTPTSDADKYQLVVTFKNSTGGVIAEPVVVDLPRSENAWTQATSGEISLPEPATSVSAVVRKGANTTGTLWIDDFGFIRPDTGGNVVNWHGANVDLPGGWFTFWPGFSNSPASPLWTVAKSTAQSHTGTASLRVERRGTAAAAPGEAVVITPRVPVTPGRPVLVSYWLKTEGTSNPELIGTTDNNNVGLSVFSYNSLQSGAAGYGQIDPGADIRLNGQYNKQVIPLLPQVASNGWTQYSFVVNPLPGAVGMEVRLRYWPEFTGVTYWDDVFIGDVADVTAQVPNLLASVGGSATAAAGFEGTTPSYWTPTGAGATWPTSQFHSGTHSIALGGAGASSWTQAEVIRNWVDRFPANTALALKVWIRADGINTITTGDTDKYQMVATFLGANGNNLTGAPLVFDLPQTTATSGWTLFSTAALGDITLPEDARSVSVTVRKGATAAGTMYFDDFSVQGSGWHGANVDLTGDWFTYWPGFDGSPATPNWVVGKTTAQAHTGTASMQVERLGAPLPGEEAVAISSLVPVAQNQPVLISYWLKTEGNVDPATIGTGDNNVGLSALWYRSLQTGRNGYDALRIDGADIRLNGEYNPQVIPLLPRQAANGWTNYAFVLNPLPGSAGLELRLRYWHTFTGKTYWDDIAITNIAGANLFNPVAGEDEPTPGATGETAERWFRANQPNPFADRTEIRFALPRAEAVTLEVYDLLGRRVALLADDAPMTADEHSVTFERGGLASGTYLVLLRTASHTEARQITVVR